MLSVDTFLLDYRLVGEFLHKMVPMVNILAPLVGHQVVRNAHGTLVVCAYRNALVDPHEIIQEITYVKSSL